MAESRAVIPRRRDRLTRWRDDARRRHQDDGDRYHREDLACAYASRFASDTRIRAVRSLSEQAHNVAVPG